MYMYKFGNCQDVYVIRAQDLTLLHSEQPKLYRVLALLSAIGLNMNIFDWCCTERDNNLHKTTNYYQQRSKYMKDVSLRILLKCFFIIFSMETYVFVTPN